MLKNLPAYLGKVMPTLIGLYIAMFWVADARYNNAITRLEARTTNLVTRLESEHWRKAIELVPSLQNRTIPVKPNFFNLVETTHSLLPCYDLVDGEVIEELQNIVVSKKNELNKLNLYSIILKSKAYNNEPAFECEESLNTPYVDLSSAIISSSVLDFAKIEFTNFTKADLTYSTFHHSKIIDSVFDNAVLNEVNFNNTVFYNVSFKGANLANANFVGSDLTFATNLDEANLQDAKYNSQAISCNDVKPLYDDFEHSCENTTALSNGSKKQCPKFINILKSLYAGSATKFPAGFDPKKHGMTDVNELIEQAKKK